MHTEGLVVFADPRVIDKRRQESWRLRAAIDLLRPENAEDTGSSLLELVAPLVSGDGSYILPVPISELLPLYFCERQTLNVWASELAALYTGIGFNARFLTGEILRRRRLMTAVESYLMANRGADLYETYRAKVGALATSTLAHSLANEETKEHLVQLFDLAIEHIESVSPDVESQAKYSKTLLGVEDAAAIEAWTVENEAVLRKLSSNDEWLHATWPLFQRIIDNKQVSGILPNGLALELAGAWIQGETYQAITNAALSVEATKPWGEDGARALNGADILKLLENHLGFDCPLVLSAVGQFLYGQTGIANEDAASLNFFQKSLKYGLPDSLSISIYELGFADRVVAQNMCVALLNAGFDGNSVEPAISVHRPTLSTVVAEYPAYFQTVLNSV